MDTWDLARIQAEVWAGMMPFYVEHGVLIVNATLVNNMSTFKNVVFLHQYPSPDDYVNETVERLKRTILTRGLRVVLRSSCQFTLAADPFGKGTQVVATLHGASDADWYKKAAAAGLTVDAALDQLEHVWQAVYGNNKTCVSETTHL